MEWDVLWLTQGATLGSLRKRFLRTEVVSLYKRGARRFGGERPRLGAMNAQELLQEIANYCRHSGLAESTFGRRAVNDGTVLLRVLRAMHDRFPTIPFYVVGKEISLEDVRLALQKMSDRFFEHPATVLVLTNLAYADAPCLAVKSLSAASSMVWHEVPLVGDSAYLIDKQTTDLVPFLSQNWKAEIGRAH